MGACVRIEQQLVGVEAVAVLGLVGAVDAVAVELAGADVGHIAVEDLVGIFGQRDPLDFLAAVLVEQAELDLGGVGGEDREIGPLAVPGGAARVRQAFFDTRGGVLTMVAPDNEGVKWAAGKSAWTAVSAQTDAPNLRSATAILLGAGHELPNVRSGP